MTTDDTLIFSYSRREALEDGILIDVLVLNDAESPKPVRLKAVCGPADDLSPCLTVMLPEED